MLVTLRNSTGLTLDLDAEPTWEASGGQSIGSARLRIPRESAAWSADVISESGGFLVDILTPAGKWLGIADAPTWTANGSGMDVRAQHVTAWAKTRHVSASRTFVGCTAGAIVRRAVADALVGLGSVPVTIGTIVEAPPVIALYEFKRQSLLSVLTDMQDQTGQQWVIDDLLRFSWRQQVGRYREVTIIDDGKYVGNLQRTPLADQYAEDIEVEQGGRAFTARNPEAPALWPAQRITRL